MVFAAAWRRRGGPGHRGSVAAAWRRRLDLSKGHNPPDKRRDRIKTRFASVRQVSRAFGLVAEFLGAATPDLYKRRSPEGVPPPSGPLASHQTILDRTHDSILSESLRSHDRAWLAPSTAMRMA
jgi:hypothetical protein